MRTQFLVGPEGMTPFGRPRRKWEENIKDLRKVGLNVMGWIHLAQDRDR
jgi:hypothetical protein